MLALIYGEDTFLSRRFLEEIKNFYFKNNPFYFFYDFSEQNINEDRTYSIENKHNKEKYKDNKTNKENIKEKLYLLNSMFNERNLFATTKVIVLQNIFSYASKDYQKLILKLFEENNIYTAKDIMVILYETTSDVDTSLFKHKAKLIKFFPLKKGKDLLDFIKKEAASFHIQIDHDALQLLEVNFSSDTAMIHFALKKLSQLDKPLITKNDVLANLYLETNSRIFDLLDALVNKNIALAFKFLDSELQYRPPVLIFWNIIKEIKILILLNQFSGKNLVTISKKFSIPYYAVKKLYSLSKKYDLKTLLNLYRRLTDYDFKIKTGKMGERLALHLIILDFNGISK